MKTTFFTILIILMLVPIGGSLSAQDADVNCAQLSATDCEVYRGAIIGLPTTFTHPRLQIDFASTVGEETFNGSGSSQFVDGLPVALDWTFEDVGQVILLADALYLQPIEGGSWTQYPALGETGLFVDQFYRSLLLSEPVRQDDAEWNGQAMAVFAGDVDPAAFLDNPAFIEIMAGLAGIDANTLADNLDLLVSLMNPAEVQTVAWVGQEDGLLHYMELAVDIGLSVPPVISDLGDLRLSLGTQIEFANHGEPLDIAAPDGDIVTSDEPFFLLGDGLNVLLVDADALSPEVTLALGEAVTGEVLLENVESRVIYGFEGQAGQVVNISMTADDPLTLFDGVLTVISPDGSVLAENDDHDSGDSTLTPFDAQLLNLALPDDGQYLIVATWFPVESDTTFTLTLAQP